jgi:6-phosphogluconolactonase
METSLRAVSPALLVAAGLLSLCASHAAGRDAEIPAEPPASPRFAFVANAQDQSVSTYVVEPDSGRLRWLNRTGIPLGVLGVDVHPSQTYLYTTSGANSWIQAHVIGENGSLTAVGPLVDSFASQSVSFHPSGRYAYATGGLIYQYTVGTDGALTKMTPERVNTRASRIAVDPIGRALYSVSFESGSCNCVRQHAIGADGALSAMSVPELPAGTNPRAVAVHPSGRYAYVANYTSGTVSQYAIGAGGALAPLSTPSVGAEGGLIEISIEPSGRYAYVLSQNFNGKVFQFAIGTNGTLSPMVPPSVPTASNNPFTLAVDPLGQYAYVVNQNNDSISQYQIGSDGRLAALAPSQIATYPEPFSIAIARGPVQQCPAPLPLPWPDPR